MIEIIRNREDEWCVHALWGEVWEGWEGRQKEFPKIMLSMAHSPHIPVKEAG